MKLKKKSRNIFFAVITSVVVLYSYGYYKTFFICLNTNVDIIELFAVTRFIRSESIRVENSDNIHTSLQTLVHNLNFILIIIYLLVNVHCTYIYCILYVGSWTYILLYFELKKACDIRTHNSKPNMADVRYYICSLSMNSRFRILIEVNPLLQTFPFSFKILY